MFWICDFLIIEIPIRESYTKEKLAKIEAIHDEHVNEIRNHFLRRINKLEKRLEKSQDILKERDIILNKFRTELQLEEPLSPINLLHRASLSKSISGDSRDDFQIDLAYQFEKQLEEMRIKCSLEVDTTKAQCNYDLEQQKLRYEQYLEEIKAYSAQEREILNDRIKRLQEELESYKASNASFVESSFWTESEFALTQILEQLAKTNKDFSDLMVKHSKDSMKYLKEKNDLELSLKEAREFGENMTKKFDDLAIMSKDEINMLNLKIKNLEKVKQEADDRIKEINDLKKQVTMLKLDMIKSESNEK